MDEKITEAFQILQLLDNRINDLDSNITRALSMGGAFAALISISVTIHRWQDALFIYFDVLAMVMFMIALWTRRRLNKEIRSPLFYTNVARANKEDFISYFNHLDQASYLQNLQEEIYRNSRSCVFKERWFNLGLISLIMSLLCWIAVNIWSLF